MPEAGLRAADGRSVGEGMPAILPQAFAFSPAAGESGFFDDLGKGHIKPPTDDGNVTYESILADEGQFGNRRKGIFRKKIFARGFLV